MAHHSSISFFMFNVLLGCFFIGLSSTKAQDLIATVCSRTQNPPLCLQSLRANPKAPKADLKGLGFIALDIASKSAVPTLKLVDSLVESTKDPILETRYEDCQELYDEAIGSLDDARTALTGGDLASYFNDASAATTDIFTCQQGFDEPKPVKGSPQLIQANKKVQALCNIAEVIGSLLNKR